MATKSRLLGAERVAMNQNKNVENVKPVSNCIRVVVCINTVTNVSTVSNCESVATTSGCNNSVGESADSDCENVEPELAPAVRGHYKHFMQKQKFAVKDYAKMCRIRAAVKHFKVPKSTVNNWNKTEFNDDNLRNRKHGHLQKSGPLTYDQEIDWLILAHVVEQRDLQILVTIEDICIHAREIVK